MTAHTAITTVVHEVAEHFKPPAAPASPPPPPSPPAQIGVVYGVPSSFAQCVAFRESTNGAGSTDLYGILPYIWTSVLNLPGSPYTASVAQQNAAFAQLYAMYGAQPWHPSDGC